jgi:hypothetical protein
MARAGHKTARAALIYQHAAEERNQVLADGIDALLSQQHALGLDPLDTAVEPILRLPEASATS